MRAVEKCAMLILASWISIYSIDSLELYNDEKACLSGDEVSLENNAAIYISSPNFSLTNPYPMNVFCSWTVKSSNEELIRVTFEVMSIWPTFNCVFDGLIVFDGNSTVAPIIGKFCTIYVPDEILSTGRSLHIVFYSSDFNNRFYHGFRMRFEGFAPLAPCNNVAEITCHNGNCVPRKFICNRKDDCGDGTDEETCNFRFRRNIPCGITLIPPVLGNDDRIVGGRAAIPGSWPWQCSLRRRGKGPNGHLCGGVLINDRWLLTAAHCFRNLYDVSLWTVHFGKYYKFKDDSNEQMRYLKRIIIHPKYSGIDLEGVDINKKDNDLALVELNAPVMIKDHVRPVCIPPWQARLADGTICHVTGWGLTLGTGNSDVLKQAAVPIVSNKKCREFYINFINVTKSMICAGYTKGGHDSCQGDSGGPLVFPRNGRWYLIGLVSTGGNCADSKQPGIYTRISSFKWWIHETIRNYLRR